MKRLTLRRILIGAGILVLVVWVIQQAKPKLKPAASGANKGKDPIISVEILDPNFEYNPQFSGDSDWENFQG